MNFVGSWIKSRPSGTEKREFPFVPITRKLLFVSAIYIAALSTLTYLYMGRTIDDRLQEELNQSQSRFDNIFTGLLDSGDQHILAIANLIPEMARIPSALENNDRAALKRLLAGPSTQLLLDLDITLIQLFDNEYNLLYSTRDLEAIDVTQFSRIPDYLDSETEDASYLRCDHTDCYRYHLSSFLVPSGKRFYLVVGQRIDQLLIRFHDASGANMVLTRKSKQPVLGTDFAHTSKLIESVALPVSFGISSKHFHATTATNEQRAFYLLNFDELDDNYYLIAIEDISNLYISLKRTATNSAIITGAAIISLSVVLIGLIYRLIVRLNTGISWLPLLANREYGKFRQLSCMQNKHHFFRDEVDLFIHVTTILNDKMEHFENQQLEQTKKLGALVNDLSIQIEARKKSQLESESKSQYVANMSHELRTPLNVVVGAARLLAVECEPSMRRQYVETIGNSATTLLNLIDQILDLSRLELFSDNSYSVNFPFIELLTEILTAIGLLAQQKGIQLDASISGNLYMIYRGNRKHVLKALLNIASNAVKYTDHGCVHIDIKFGDTHGRGIQQVYIQVTDTGAGISEDIINHLFEPFVQASRESIPSTGLGTYIAKHAIESIGGSIDMTSVKGEGSCFTLNFNLEVIQEAPTKIGSSHALLIESQISIVETVTEILGKKGFIISTVSPESFPDVLHATDFDGARNRLVIAREETLNQLLDCTSSRSSSDLLGKITRFIIIGHARPAHYRFNARQPRYWLNVPTIADLESIATGVFAYWVTQSLRSVQPLTYKSKSRGKILDVLIAEDDKPTRYIMERAFKMRGHRVTSANNGLDTLKALNTSTYDAAVLDRQMPELDGIAVIEAFKLQKTRNNTLFAIVSADATLKINPNMADDRIRFYSKPVDPFLIVMDIEQWAYQTGSTDDTENQQQINHPQSLSNSGIIDSERLDRYLEGVTDTQYLGEIIDESVSAFKSSIREAFRDNNIRLASQSIHAIAGCMASLGAIEPVNTCNAFTGANEEQKQSMLNEAYISTLVKEVEKYRNQLFIYLEIQAV